jgi:antitoxin (DNA-binding transcriptional repressor) of toxin-antitoxin stability system
MENKDVDLLDVLKARVEAGESIYITRATPAGVTHQIDELRQKFAAETGKPVRVIEVVDLPEIPTTSPGQ